MARLPAGDLGRRVDRHLAPVPAVATIERRLAAGPSVGPGQRPRQRRVHRDRDSALAGRALGVDRAEGRRPLPASREQCASASRSAAMSAPLRRRRQLLAPAAAPMADAMVGVDAGRPPATATEAIGTGVGARTCAHLRALVRRSAWPRRLSSRRVVASAPGIGSASRYASRAATRRPTRARARSWARMRRRTGSARRQRRHAHAPLSTYLWPRSCPSACHSRNVTAGLPSAAPGRSSAQPRQPPWRRS